MLLTPVIASVGSTSLQIAQALDDIIQAQAVISTAVAGGAAAGSSPVLSSPESSESSSDDEEDSNVYPQEHEDKASKCKEILLAMKNVLDDEEIYIEYFKKLVDVVNGIEYSKMIANINQSLSLGLKGSTIPNGNCKQPRVDQEQPLNPKNLFWTLEERYLNDSNICQHSFKGDKTERNAKRNKILHELLFCHDQHEKWLNLIGRLIDVEESFII